jgi:hypothetical protein
MWGVWKLHIFFCGMCSAANKRKYFSFVKQNVQRSYNLNLKFIFEVLREGLIRSYVWLLIWRYPSLCVYRLTYTTLSIPSVTKYIYYYLSNTTCFDEADRHRVFILYKNFKTWKQKCKFLRDLKNYITYKLQSTCNSWRCVIDNKRCGVQFKT